MKIRTNDQVVILTGKDRGPGPRKVKEVLPESNKIIVEGVNLVYRHLRPSKQNPQGGRLSKEMPIAASNALLYCPSCARGVRVGLRFTEAGQKQRYCKKCGNGLGDVGPVKPRHAASQA